MDQSRNTRQGSNPRRGRTQKRARARFNMSMQKKLVVLFMLILLAFLGLAGRLVFIVDSKGEEYTKIRIVYLTKKDYNNKLEKDCYKKGSI